MLGLFSATVQAASAFWFHWDDYERGRRLMTAAANAAVAGVIDAEPAAEVLVADAHGPARGEHWSRIRR